MSYDRMQLMYLTQQCFVSWILVSQWTFSFLNTDQPVRSRPERAGVPLGEGREDKSTGSTAAGAEEGGEGDSNQTATEGPTGQERGGPSCSLESGVHSQDHQLWYDANVQLVSFIDCKRLKKCLKAACVVSLQRGTSRRNLSKFTSH